VNYDAIRKNIEKLHPIGFPGFVLQGQSGSFPYLDTSERVELVEMSRDIIDDIHSRANPAKYRDCPMLMAGAGAESTLECQKMCETMALAGADCFLIVTPSFYKMSEYALIRHFTEVADFSPKPIVISNLPNNTSVDMSAEAIAELANHPNICGIKESSGDIAKIGHILHLTREIKVGHFQVLAGSASILFSAVALGASGGICSLANVLPSECVHLYDLTQRGQFSAACDLQKRLIGPNTVITKKYGLPGLKAAMDYYGLDTGDLRAPLLELDKKEIEEVQNAFFQNGFIGVNNERLQTNMLKFLSKPNLTENIIKT